MSSGFPDLIWVRQAWTGPTEPDPAARTSASLAALDLGASTAPGQTVAVGVGSRGITDLVPVVRATVDHLRSLGLEPFVFPAMGSHGGATAAGQVDVLSGYGATEATIGAPVRATMDTVVVATSSLGIPLHLDAHAAAADHIVVVNRAKPHTTLTGPVESGLVKMALIGAGKQAGAERHHQAIFEHGWPALVDAHAPLVLDRVLAGVAIVENEADHTALVEAIAGRDVLRREPELLTLARTLLPRLPFDEFDVLLIDRIGKNISGTGFDTNVVGRKASLHAPDPSATPRIGTIGVRGLTPETHGNAMGIGLAELCRSRVVDEMDRAATAINATTSGNLPAGMVPIACGTDAVLLAACATRLGGRTLADARIAWIRDTLHLDVVAVSASFLDEVHQRDDLTLAAGPTPMPLDDAGNLPDLLPF